MKKIIWFILIFFISHSLIAQKHFFEGYIVNLEGDTIHGYVGYNNWNSNPEHVNFRTSEGGEIIRHTVKDILSFYVANDLYTAVDVQHEVSPRELNLLKYNRDLIIVNEKVFLQVLFKGEKGLASFKSNSGADNYYIWLNGKYELLIHKQYLKVHNKEKVVKSNNKYIGQLSLYFHDCSDLTEKIQKIKYMQGSLENLFSDYYSNYSTSSVEFAKNKEKDFIIFGALAGLVHTSVVFNGRARNNITTVQFTNDITASIGVSLEWIFARNFNHWSLNNELLLTSFSNSATSTDVYITSEYDLSYTYLSMNNMFRYKYYFNKLDVFGNFGMSTGFVMSGENSLTTYDAVFGTTKSQAIFDHKKIETGLLVGAGMVVKDKYQVEIRYQYSGGMSPYIDIQSLIGRLFFLVIYRF